MFAFFSIKEMCYVLTEQSEEIGQEDLDWIWPPKIPFFWAIINLFVLKPFFMEKNYFSLSQEKSTMSPQIQLLLTCIGTEPKSLQAESQ